MTTVENVFEQAISLLRQGWIQKCYARDSVGDSVSVNNPWAVSFCMAGAIQRALSDCAAEELKNEVWAALCNRKPMGDIVPWNDAKGRTAEEVIGFLEKCKKDASGTA